MVRIIIALLFCFPAVAFAQTYQQLSERAIECIEKDSLPKAEELLLQALKLEPKNAKNALLFSNLGLVQRRLGEFDKALESYSFALNFAPLAVPILLDRAAIYMEMGLSRLCFRKESDPFILGDNDLSKEKYPYLYQMAERARDALPVSYTHLTLPTNSRV